VEELSNERLVRAKEFGDVSRRTEGRKVKKNRPYYSWGDGMVKKESKSLARSRNWGARVSWGQGKDKETSSGKGTADYRGG